MDYVVAVDRDRQTSAAYLEAFGVRGIPHAFIVDQSGRIVWHGNPLSGLDRALEQVVAGTYDLEKEKKRIAAQAKLNQYYNLVSVGGNEALLETRGRELEALDAELGGIQPGEKFNAAEVRRLFRFQRLMEDYQQAVRAGGSDAELAAIHTNLAAAAPADFPLAEFSDRMQLNRIFLNYFYAAAGERGTNRLEEFKRELLGVTTTNFHALNQYAWSLLTDPKLQQRDFALAARLAHAGVAASEGKVAAVLDTHARALFELGRVAEAIAEQKRALAVAASEEEIRLTTTALKRYEAHAAKIGSN
jgi:hypothetical protein